jgi:hypothetical protein
MKNDKHFYNSQNYKQKLKLTLRSLKGCIKMPRGSLDLSKIDFDSGIFVSVLLKILKMHSKLPVRLICNLYKEYSHTQNCSWKHQ